MFVGLFALGFHASDAQADATWKNLRGHSACGGVDQAGRLQPPCSFLPIEFKKAVVADDLRCPKGTVRFQGDCFACPQGFNHNTLRKITHERACRKKVPDQTAPAVFLGPGKCTGNANFYPRNGGECWACPAGFARTLAKVDQWNACGKVGKKAQAAAFIGRACPDEDAIRDPRNGGECWKCPEDFGRTANPVTGARACKTSFAFLPANKIDTVKCPPGQHFFRVDQNGTKVDPFGVNVKMVGSCWACPDQTKRAFGILMTPQGLNKAKACRNNKMHWVAPTRQLYGLFGLGAGADDILAKMIAERTEIDTAVAQMAQASGVAQNTLQAKAWELIDDQPWQSPVLSSLLGRHVMAAAAKPAGQRTPSEKDLLARIAQLIQWNRQFVAYQAKQAHETWVRASKAAFDVSLSKMGAAAVYADSMVTPPNYNDVLVASIQGGSMIAGPVGAALIPLISQYTQAVIFPYRAISQEVIRNAAGEVIKETVIRGKAIAGGMSTGATMTAAAVGPMMVAAAASVIITMEIDKFLALEKAEGQIRQALAIADRPVDVSVLLQDKGGPEEFLFHWSSLFGAPTKPSANFTARLAAYKAGKTPGAITAGPTSAPVGSTSQPGMTTGTGAVALSGGLPGANAPAAAEPAPQQQAEPQQQAAVTPPRLGEILEREIMRLSPFEALNSGAMRIELSNQDGQCMSKQTGASWATTTARCAERHALWIKPDAARKALVFADKYCLHATAPKRGRNAPGYVVVNECKNSRAQQWLLTQEGLIQQANTNQCMTASENGQIALQDCGSDIQNQVWRERAVR
jgi:hypothetical protein